jgi:hypothetical protein
MPKCMLNGLNGHINRLSLHPNFMWLLSSIEQYSSKNAASSVNFQASIELSAECNGCLDNQ